jgi:hypothetical protein
MASLWPWLAVAGLGALHGLSPANGWMFAAAWGLRECDGARIRLALLPIAIGHTASIALVAWAMTQGLSMDRALVQTLAGALLVGAAAYRLLRGDRPTPILTPAGPAGLALWSFVMATAHGAGMMLLPALVPLCLADSPAREITASGSLGMALAAVGVHTAAMLATIGAIAGGLCRSIARNPGLLSGTASRHVWTATLAFAGLLLLAMR